MKREIMFRRGKFLRLTDGSWFWDSADVAYIQIEGDLTWCRRGGAIAPDKVDDPVILRMMTRVDLLPDLADL